MEAVEGAILNNLGTLSERRDDLEAASDFYGEALAIKRRLYPDSVDVAIGLRNLAEIERQLGNLSRAQELLESSLEMSQRVAPNGLEIARTQLTLSKVRWDQGKSEAAERQLAAARAQIESDFPSSQEMAAVESEAARQALGGTDPQSARPHLERSIAVTERFAPSSRRIAEALYDLARLARDRGDLVASTTYFDRAITVVDELARHNGGSQEVRSAFRSQFSSLYDGYESLLLDLGREREAFAVVEKSRARVLLGLLAERDLVFSADIPDELDRRRRRLDLEYDRAIAHLATLDPADSEATDATRTDIESLRAERRRVRDEIRAASPRLAALTDPRPVDAEAALRELGPGTIALSFSVVPDETRVYVLGPGPTDFAVHRLPIGRDEISNRVTTLNDAVSRGSGRRGRAALEMAAAALSDLVAPAEAALGRADHLLVIPDGALHWLPFAVLPDPGHPARALVERLPIRIESSFSTLAQLHQRSATAARRTIVAFGDPVYPSGEHTNESAADRSATLTRLDLSPLPASRREIAALERLFGDQVTAHVGPQATEGSVKALHGTYRAVHLACHAFVDPERPLESGVVLSMPSPDGQSVTPDENGILQAWEVFEQVRFNADLVTLSACETALGGYVEGEGILGLTRAFQHAGASAVLASLWRVEDEASADLMESFYRHLADGDRRDEALRQAQIEALRGNPATGRPPAAASQWAAFQLYGD
jgi:CHAT domain-containing protein